jgi:PAS domain S-box-containing protein
MEETVMRSEKKYRELFENANDIIYTHDLDGTFTSVNAVGERTYGYSREELKGLNLRSIVDAAFLPVVQEKIREKAEGGGPTGPYELLTYGKDGRRIWVEVNTRVKLNDDGRMEVEGIARDITERKRTEGELAESRKQISDVVQYMPAIICEIDTGLNVVWTNREGLKTFGYTEEDVKAGIRILDIVHPDHRESLLRDVENIRKGDFGNFVEHCFIRKDGALVYLIVNSVPILKDGQFTGIRSYVVDITAQREAQRMLVQSEERFRGIFEASPIGIALFDAAGKPRAINDSFRTMFSLPENTGPADLSFGLFDLVPQAGECCDELTGGQGVQLETDTDIKAVREKDALSIVSAGTRFLLWRITPLRDENGGPCMLLAQVEDISERKRAEEEKLSMAREEADKARRMLDGLRRKIGEPTVVGGMVGASEGMQKIFELLPAVAQVSTTILVTGESGTGKELVARALHDQGPRKDKPFIPINCSALPDTLLESELFGYKAGAFTDAKKDKPGKLKLADGGTLFLDEIGDISPAMQAKLLRVLQHRVIEPLGDTKSVTVDVRVIAATNRDLPQMVKEGKFREDLLYRIKVLTITLPPLRDRRRDIPALCSHFIAIFNKRYSKNIQKMSSETMDILLAYHYPGNIRELENAIEHAFIFCKGPAIEPVHLPADLANLPRGVPCGNSLDGIDNFEDLERMFLRKIIEEAGGNKNKAARKLGIHKVTLFRKIKALGLDDV